MRVRGNTQEIPLTFRNPFGILVNVMCDASPPSSKDDLMESSKNMFLTSRTGWGFAGGPTVPATLGIVRPRAACFLLIGRFRQQH
jgi:hypothetical protein